MSARRTDRGSFDAERFEELRTLRALGTLTAAECREFTALLAERANVDLEADDLTVAALELARLGPELAPLPQALAQRLQADAQAHFAARGAQAPASAARASTELANTEPASAAPASAAPASKARGAADSAVPVERKSTAPSPTTRSTSRETPIHELRPRSSRGSWGWVAAAAALVLALVGWWPRVAGPDRVAPAAARDELLAHGGVLTVPWQGTDFAKGADGDVVWDPATQRGFMRIRGLAKNDPAREQYQLWIFDETQKHPIDGGVFDVGADGELVIPIDPKLHVAKPTLFAVTVEKPGGVVVSAQEKIVLAGKI
ncbi:MAG: anti-sigma factor [Planctomycetes bacterium]|nr:anti-sigma factor [Planctomycetota bacterium]